MVHGLQQAQAPRPHRWGEQGFEIINFLDNFGRTVAVCILRGKVDPGPAPRTGEGGRRLRWRCALSVRSGTMGALMKAGVLWTATARPLGCAAVDAATAVVSEEGRLRHR